MRIARMTVLACVPALVLLSACGSSGAAAPTSTGPTPSETSLSGTQQTAPLAADKNSMAGFKEIGDALKALRQPLESANEAVSDRCSASTLRSAKCKRAVEQLAKIATQIHLGVLSDGLDGIPDGYRCRAQKTFDKSLIVSESADVYLDQQGLSDSMLKVALGSAALEGLRLQYLLRDWRYVTDEMLGYSCD